MTFENLIFTPQLKAGAVGISIIQRVVAEDALAIWQRKPEQKIERAKRNRIKQLINCQGTIP